MSKGKRKKGLGAARARPAPSTPQAHAKVPAPEAVAPEWEDAAEASGLLHPVRHILRVTVEAETPLSVASGEADVDLDTPLFRDWNGYPCLSGATIAGVLRAQHADRDADHGRATDALFGIETRDRASGRASELLVSFGYVHGATDRVVTGDNRPAQQVEDDDVLALLARPAPVLRDHVAIDAVRGAAADTAKFDRAVCPTGTRFSFELAIDGGADAKARLLEAGRLLHSPYARFGGGGRRGLGRFKVVRADHASIDRSGSAGRTRWLAYRKSRIDERPTAAGLTWTAVANDPPTAPSRRAPIEGTITLNARGAWRMGSGTRAWSTDDGEKRSRTPPLEETVIAWATQPQRVAGRLEDVTTGSPQFERRVPIPGSGVKGALAHRAEFHRRRIAKLWGATDADRRMTDTLFGAVGDGADGRAGAVMIDDTHVTLTSAQTVRRTRVSIDRHTGGPRDGALFSDETPWKGPVLTIKLTVLTDGLAPGDLDALDWAIDDLCKGRLALGAGDGIGDGVFEGTATWGEHASLKAAVEALPEVASPAKAAA